MGGQCQVGRIGEVGSQRSVGQFVAIPEQPRERDLRRYPAFQPLHAGWHSGWNHRTSRSGTRDERERHPIDLGVFWLEHAFFIRCIAHASQRPAHDLLAQELGSEGANPENVRDRVGVPTLGQHRDTDDAADMLAESSLFADRVHHFPQQVLVAQFIGVPAGEALPVLFLELLDLQRGELLELRAHCIAGFQLLAVDEDRVGAVPPLPGSVIVGEDRQLARLYDGLFPDLFLPTCDVVEHHFRHVGVVADHDEHRRRASASPFPFLLRPSLVGSLVVAVETL